VEGELFVVPTLRRRDQDPCRSQPRRNVGSLSGFSIENGELDRNRRTIRRLGMGMQHRKPLTDNGLQCLRASSSAGEHLLAYRKVMTDSVSCNRMKTSALRVPR